MPANREHHRTLARQLRRLGVSAQQPPENPQWGKLLALISDSYEEADADRYTMERSIEIASDEMLTLNQRLLHRARHDSLTGLFNRSALTEVLGDSLALQPSGTSSAVLFIDLDGFKLVNDTLGHSAGDELLVRASERIRSAVRQQDVIARQGGDEFVVLCMDIADIEVATEIARRVSAKLEAPFRIGDHDAVVSASIGISLAQSGCGDPDALLRDADTAMYEAKKKGRSQFVVFNSEMQTQLDGRLSTQNALRHAVDNGELLLHYQPLIRLSDHHLLGMEALVRWDRPGRGMVPPDEFISIAEQSRLITDIDKWVIQEACRQAASWPEDDASIAVNLSARDLQQDEIITSISDTLGCTGLAPRRLVVELTETTIMSGSASIGRNLRRLADLGVELAIDDFGTGYSSLAYLRQIPAQTLKMDRSFVCDVDEDEASAAIVGAIVTMGHALGLRIVAEGVERSSQARRLRELGCDAAQGYLFARPLPADELERYFASAARPSPRPPSRRRSTRSNRAVRRSGNRVGTVNGRIESVQETCG